MTPYPHALTTFPSLRQSLLARFDECGLATKFDLDYRRDWTSHPAARGRVFHRVAAKCLTEMYHSKQRSVEVGYALSVLQDTLRQHDVDRECPSCPEPIVDRLPSQHGGTRIICEAGHEHSSDLSNLPLRVVRDLYWVVKKWASEWEFDIANLVDVEQRLKATVSYPDGQGGKVERVLTGALDALFVEGDHADHGVVLDWKDTWGLPAPTEVSFGGYFQQRFYAFLIFSNYPSITRVTLREAYPRHHAVREITLWREDFDEVTAELAALAERFDRTYEQGAWAPTPGKQCSYCPKPTACPIPAFVRGAGRITNEEEAEKVAAQLLVSEAVLKQTKEALAAWSNVTGPIPVKDAKGKRVYGYRASSRVKRPDKEHVAAEIALARREGRPPNIERLWQEATVTRFESYQQKPEDTPEAEDAAMLSALEKSLREVHDE